MSTLDTLLEQIDAERIRLTDQYFDLHVQLNKYKNKAFADLSPDDMPDVERILIAIQDTFQELYPLLHFIGAQHPNAISLANGYHKFIQDLEILTKPLDTEINA